MESNQPLMSVKEARKRLGKRYSHLADEQVESLITLLSKLATATVQELGSKVTY